MPDVLNVCVGRTRPVQINGRKVATAAFKEAVDGPVPVRAQARAALWDDTLAPGALGENLLLQGLLETELFVGDRLVLPQCVLAVSEPRLPCFKFNAAMGFNQAGKLMVESGFCGTYLAVLEPGSVQAGDSVRLVPGPRDVNIRALFKSRTRRG